jgi:peptide/nickel transport system ATP-binding protein
MQEQDNISDVILSIDHFSVFFKTFDGKVQALQDINLQLKKGKILGIIGESGSGKSTIALSILNLIPENAEVTGNILYNNTSIYEKDRNEKGKITKRSKKILDDRLQNIRWKDISMVFQGAMNAFNPVQPIKKQIIEVFKVHGTFDNLKLFEEGDYIDRDILSIKAREIAYDKKDSGAATTNNDSEEHIFEELLRNQLDIVKNGSSRKKRELLATTRIERVSRIAGFNTAFLDSYPHELSGGMKQRALISMALALYPRILIADEPTTGLDVIAQAKIIKELKRLKKEDIIDSMIIISHDVGVVSQLADSVAVMYAGRIMEYGKPADIFNNSVNPYTYALINSYPSLKSTKTDITGIPGHIPDLLSPPKGCYFAERCFMADTICFNETPPVKQLSGDRLTMCHFDSVNKKKYEESKYNIISPEYTVKKQDPILITKELSKYFSVSSSILTSLFGGPNRMVVHAVDKVSIEIKKGQIIGVVGESGSGKSTLGRLLVGSIPANNGKLYFYLPNNKAEEKTNVVNEMRTNNNSPESYLQDITNIAASGKKNYAFKKESQLIFQDPYDSLNPKKTIYDSVSQPLKIKLKNTKRGNANSRNSNFLESQISDNKHNYIDNKIVEALESSDLTPASNYLERYPHELSGGERQRVSIARTIAISPSFLVADEPISMLDVSIRADILNLLKKLREMNNMSIIYISHDIASARYVSDNILVMYLGQIIEYGTSEEIINNPFHPYTKALILSVPDLDPNWVSKNFDIFGEIGNAINPREGCRFYDRCIYRKDICKNKEPPMLIVKERYYKCHFAQSELLVEKNLITEE